MLSTKHRLTRKQDFALIYEHGVFVPGTLINMKVWRVDPAQFPRRGYGENDLKIGFVVGTKIDKRAVVRNRVKRQLREVVRLLIKDGVVKTGYLVAIMAKPDIAGKEYAEIEASLVQALRRARLIQT